MLNWVNHWIGYGLILIYTIYNMMCNTIFKGGNVNQYISQYENYVNGVYIWMHVSTEV